MHLELSYLKKMIMEWNKSFVILEEQLTSMNRIITLSNWNTWQSTRPLTTSKNIYSDTLPLLLIIELSAICLITKT